MDLACPSPKFVQMFLIDWNMAPMAGFSFSYTTVLLLCQPRVEVTSCFVYKIMGLTVHDRINTQLIYRFELAQVVARMITKLQIFI